MAVAGVAVAALVAAGEAGAGVRAAGVEAAAGAAGTLTLTSPAFGPGGAIPKVYTCEGAGKRPTLAWRGIPRGTRSLAIEVVDPDAPIRGGFTHWLAWGIDPARGALAGNAKVAHQGAPSFGAPGWVPPCPMGRHRYVFTLSALKAPLPLPDGAGRAAFEQAVRRAGVLGRATLTGLFTRG